MKYIIALLVITPVILIACQSVATKSLLNKPGAIPADEYNIDITKDTTLQTKHGALLKIPAGSLSAGNGTMITLEIKEAYSIEQMIQSGLTTQAGDEPLSSGGMIYINAKGGQNVTIKQAIKVALPTRFLDPQMKLYKGETTSDSMINWVNPVALPENKQLTAIQTGEAIFQQTCSSCHAIGKDGVGPDLAHIIKRFGNFGEEGLWRYFDHGYQSYPDGGYQETDFIGKDVMAKKFYHPDPFTIYKCNLLNRYSTAGPPLFNTDTSSVPLSVYQYIQNESERLKLSLPAHHYLFDCADSCIQYEQRVKELQEQKKATEATRNKLIDEGTASTEEIKIKTGPVPEPPVDLDDVVSPNSNKGVYYQFSIETFGWYNIDVLLKEMNGTEESELSVRIVGTYKERLDIFLIIPDQKIYTKAGKKKDGTDEYVFAYTNGKIFLPQHARAYVLAMTESGTSIAFDLVEFTTTKSQQVQMELKASTKEAFTAAIDKLNSGNMKISVSDSKNADSIRKKDAELKTINEQLKNAESLKPKNCDCDCLEKPPKPITAVEINAADSIATYK